MMEINGLDYNTQRSPLMMPEYGREIQKMVDYAVTIADRGERQRCAETIVQMMATKVPQLRENTDYEQTLWDHLYLMSRKQLDIKWPYDVAAAEKICNKPEPMRPPKAEDRVRMRHYGHLIEAVTERLKSMPEGPERDALTHVAANQMKRALATWGHGSMNDERVAADLERLTDGRVRLDLSTFKLDKVEAAEPGENMRKKKRK